MNLSTSFRLLCLLAVCGAGLAAHAQEFTPPPFEALEQQRATSEQRAYDQAEKSRIAEQQTYLANPGQVSAADHALRQLELQRQLDQLRLQSDLTRMQTTNERAAVEASLPNRRIARASVLVVAHPEDYALPPAPKGQYYARLEGRFVLVDAMSELVVGVVPAPAEPRGDTPLGVPPPPLPGAPISPAALPDR